MKYINEVIYLKVFKKQTKKQINKVRLNIKQKN